jgi:hypothetical protein
MKTRRLRRKRPPCLDWGADRAVITVVLLSVTTVLLLIGFSGPSVYFRLPGPAGWLYIGVVIITAAAALFFDDKRRKGKPFGLGTPNRRPKRSSPR